MNRYPKKAFEKIQYEFIIIIIRTIKITILSHEHKETPQPS